MVELEYPNQTVKTGLGFQKLTQTEANPPWDTELSIHLLKHPALAFCSITLEQGAEPFIIRTRIPFFFFSFFFSFSHVFPIPIPSPTSLPTRSLQVLPEHEVRVLVSCIHPGPVMPTARHLLPLSTWDTLVSGLVLTSLVFKTPCPFSCLCWCWSHFLEYSAYLPKGTLLILETEEVMPLRNCLKPSLKMA